MPKYTFTCPGCGAKLQINLAPTQRNEPQTCSCGAILQRQLSKTAEPTIMEKEDRHRNVSLRKDHDKRVRARAKGYFLNAEIDALIAKYGIDHAKKMGWVKKNGKKTNKSDLK